MPTQGPGCHTREQAGAQDGYGSTDTPQHRLLSHTASITVMASGGLTPQPLTAPAPRAAPGATGCGRLTALRSAAPPGSAGLSAAAACPLAAQPPSSGERRDGQGLSRAPAAPAGHKAEVCLGVTAQPRSCSAGSAPAQTGCVRSGPTVLGGEQGNYSRGTVLWDAECSMQQPGLLLPTSSRGAQSVCSILGCISSSVASRPMEGILPLH